MGAVVANLILRHLMMIGSRLGETIMGKKYQQMNGEKLPEFRARCAAAEAAEKAERRRQAKNARQCARRAESKKIVPPMTVDRVDGRTRDDLGGSLDF